MTRKMSVIITDDTDREDLFAELYSDEEQWAEMIFDRGKNTFTIEIFAPSDASSYLFELEDVQRAIEEAKSRLMTMGYAEKASGRVSP